MAIVRHQKQLFFFWLRNINMAEDNECGNIFTSEEKVNFIDLLKLLESTIQIQHIIRCNIYTGMINGVIKVGEIVLQFKREEDQAILISSNIDKKTMTLWLGGDLEHLCKVNTTTAIPFQIIDLDRSGRRWEGSSFENIPFGYGQLFDDEDRLEYEGFLYGKTKVCYGVEYYPEVGIEKYRGFFCFGDYYLDGVQKDRHGSIEYEGEWINRKAFDPDLYTLPYFHSHIPSWIISKDFGNEPEWTELHMSCLLSLEKIIFSGHSAQFKNVHTFTLDYLPKLKIFRCTCQCCNDSEEYYIPADKGVGCLQISNCPSLEVIEIGAYAFLNYSSLQLSNLPALQRFSAIYYSLFYIKKVEFRGKDVKY